MNIVNKITLFIILSLFCFPLLACSSSSITITVLDAETNKPIEGAAAIVFWNQTKGVPGLTRTETVKIVEVVSDKDGKFTIPPASVSIFADKPHLKVYKYGYVGWDSKLIYKGYYDDKTTPKIEKRTDFKWKKQIILLGKINNNHTYSSHYSFLNGSLPLGSAYSGAGGNGLFKEAIRREVPLIRKERKKYNLN